MSRLNDHELTEGWSSVALKEVAEMRLGKMLDARKQVNGTPLPYLRNINVRWGEFELSQLLTMRFDDDEIAEFELRPGDVLVCEGGEPGRAAVWQHQGSNIKFQKAIHRVRLQGGVDSRWLMYHLRNDTLRGVLDEYFTGSTIKHLTGVSFAGYRLKLAPVAEQQRIVAKVDALLASVNAARQRLAQVPAILKRFRQSVLAAACSGRLTADWRKAPPVEHGSKLLERILAKRREFVTARGKYVEPVIPGSYEFAELPDDWSWATVDAVATKVVDGVHKKPNYVANGVPFVTVRNLTAGPGISFETLNYITRSDHEEFIKRANPELGDILVTKDGTLGVVRAIRSDKEFSIFVSVALIKPVLREMSVYLEVILAAPQVQERMVHTGTGLQHIHLRDLRGTGFPLPPLAEQHEIVRRVGALFRLADAIEKRVAAATARADKLTQAILAKAFRGELVPTEAELARREGRDYEPASALLERIRTERDGTAAAPKRRPRRRPS
jgi:type I restriction enzyme S subunit